MFRNGTKTKVRPGMKSILESNPLDDFIVMAEMEDKDFEVTKVINEDEFMLQSFQTNKNLSEQFSTIQDTSESKRQRIQEFTTDSFQQLQLVIPRKPKWNHNMTAEQINRNENNQFLSWRRAIASLEQQYSYLLKLTPYEKNIEVWRQLWRVSERSNLVVQVIDARNPLLYYTKDLQEYLTKEFSQPKAMILLVNKSDLLTDHQRSVWQEYFKKMKIKVLFYSAFLSQKELDSLTDEELLNEIHTSNSFDFQSIYSQFTGFLNSFSLNGLKDQYEQQQKYYKNKEVEEKQEYQEDIVWGDFAKRTSKNVSGKSNTPGNQKNNAKKETEPEVELEEESEEEEEEEDYTPNMNDMVEVLDDDDEEEVEGESEGEDEEEEEENDVDEDEDEDEDESEEDDENEEGEEPLAEKPSAKSYSQRSPVPALSETCKVLSRRELLGIMTFLSKVMKDEIEIIEEKVVKTPLFMNTSPENQKTLPPNSFRASFGLVGFPNVGKSSVINTLLGVSRSNHGKIRVGVSSTPGKTKHFQTLILSNDIMLCDCPGLVFPSIMSSAGEMLCSGILPVNHMRDHMEPANLIAARVPSHLLEAVYGMKIVRHLDLLDTSDRPPTGEEVMAAYCKIKGYITGVTGRWDDFRACKEILRDFNDGHILYVAMPPKINENGVVDPNNRTYSKEEKELWIKETERTIVRSQRIADRIEKNKVTILPTDIHATNPLDSVLPEDNNENSEGQQEIFYEFIEEETPVEAVSEEMASLSMQSGTDTTMIHPNRVSGRDHKRLKAWGKKGKKLRDKTPYGEVNDMRNYTVHVKNRSSTGVDLVK
jgi:large subunit GTPase 1